MIPFNKTYLTGKEKDYINHVLDSGKYAGNGNYTRKCSAYFNQHFGLTHNFLTSSCTDALEMAALLSGIQPGDEVILPSYTFVSTANAFALRGAKLIFADSNEYHPNIAFSDLEKKITPKTKLIVVVHYAGMACEMKAIMELANQKGIAVVEDAAQGVDAYYNNQVLGSIGTFGAYSFHETKNIICGEGGLFIVNEDSFLDRAAIIWEKGTNRKAFFEGKVNSYGWKDIGSSFYPPETSAAFLYAQLEEHKKITASRLKTWSIYRDNFNEIIQSEKVSTPEVKPEMKHNAQHYFLFCKSKEERTKLLSFLKEKEITASFHYMPLHQSDYFHSVEKLPNAERFGETLIRLPLYNFMPEEDTIRVIDAVKKFYC